MHKAQLALVIASLGAGAAFAGHGKPPKPVVQPLAIAEIRVEQNSTDGDTEIVMLAKGGDEGLRQLTVTAPDGRRVVVASSKDPSILGQREFLFESPEPPGDAVLAAYPEGQYRFKGVTHAGVKFAGAATLSHQLPAPAVILSPQHEATVSGGTLTIQWSAVPGVTQYLLEFENQSADPEQVLTLNLPPEVTSFEVPPSLLAPGADFLVSIGTVAPNGNRVSAEVEFQTE